LLSPPGVTLHCTTGRRLQSGNNNATKGNSVNLLKFKKKLLVIPVVVLAASGGTALAALSGSSGGAQLQMVNRGDNVASFTSSTTYSDVPGATAVVSVPSGTSQLINARFTAESNCTRANPALGGWCSTRIVAQRIGGATVELSPQAGLDYAFDSVATDQYEGHAMERSIRLGVGTYIVRAQRAVTNNAISFRLDDWHLAVEKSA
jgi:hypothetical protein